MSTTNTSAGMVIVGAGHCGGRAALCLRQQGWMGEITLIGDEQYLPYERPALSKSLLCGDGTFEALHLATQEGWQEANVTLRLGIAVAKLDRRRQVVELKDGSEVPYQCLLLATGGTARRLSFQLQDSPRIHSLRSYADMLRLQPLLSHGKKVVIIGGGFIGLEIAATACELGCTVTVVEGASRLLSRAVPATVAERVAQLHMGNGIVLSLGCYPEEVKDHGTGVAVTLQNGCRFDADLVVVGVGMQPRTELAQAAGLKVDLGIVVDDQLRTSDPKIFAAGDACEFPSRLSKSPTRQETWYNAESQAALVASNMLGKRLAYQDTPWFWSDQFEHTLQVCGEPALAVHTATRYLENDGIIQFHTNEMHQLIGFSGFGRQNLMGRDLKVARKLVERSVVLALKDLADASVPLKKWLSAH
ncbi:FAD-dependent oxidoreductase [Pseudomonas corrugata]|uniref:FAD-dependent oxidoreductase n=1 Tax=Pseudomonas corrugata TaxID=47879 RepID=A0A7Y6DFJ6_9PSED|nr:FAD-dependent oxidoreductase [Pseudomonas corrugata]NUT85061.1 FAD-dependent oxidoreductase [Pseudomonas corrugata]